MARRHGILVVALLGVGVCVRPVSAQERVERNVVYGMYSGLALLMDAHLPQNPNGFAILVVSGSGWQSPLGADAEPLKESGLALNGLAKPLVQQGFTVFTINHRQAPRFHYPAAVEDAQRAVRFVRHFADRYRVRGDRIGALGHSSGGHLVEMLGTLDGMPLPNGDAVDRESAKVQCVVAVAGAADLASFHGAAGEPFVTSFMGVNLIASNGRPFLTGTPEADAYRDASPIAHVSADDAPTLLIHGDADPVVPFKQSEELEQRLRAVGVPVRLVREAGGGHVWNETWVGFSADILSWFKQYLLDRQ